jgi:hypothetical protein
METKSGLEAGPEEPRERAETGELRPEATPRPAGEAEAGRNEERPGADGEGQAQLDQVAPARSTPTTGTDPGGAT